MILEALDLAVSRGRVQILSGINLGIEEGEFVSLIGPSGAGKSTLLHALAGFFLPDQGSVRFRGKLIESPYSCAGRVILVWQNLGLFSGRSVRWNAEFGLRVVGAARGPREAAVDEILEELAILRLADRNVDDLSGGERQRVALARALVLRPDVLLLDEPMGALDVQLRTEVQDLLASVHSQHRLAMVMVTHHSSDAMVLSSRVAVLKAGQILQVASPRDLVRQPADAFVAAFAADADVFETERVVGAAGPVEAVVEGKLIMTHWAEWARLPDDPIGAVLVVPSGAARLAQPVQGVRPQDCGARLEGVVAGASLDGPQARVYVRLASGARVRAYGQPEPAEVPALGDRVIVELDREKCFLLSRSSKG
jgi:ABC-type Fe3+/spermidine/putrescine transport system ATPase subunit